MDGTGGYSRAQIVFHRYAGLFMRLLHNERFGSPFGSSRGPFDRAEGHMAGWKISWLGMSAGRKRVRLVVVLFIDVFTTGMKGSCNG
jgi:hypothetical protein